MQDENKFMHTRDNNDLREVVNSHLGPKAGEASNLNFEKAKSELIFTKTALTKSIRLLTIEKYLEIVELNSQVGAPGENSATDTVDSYFIPLPSESINAAFARAKRESIAKLKNEVAQLKYFSFKDYSFKRKKKAPAKKLSSTNFDNVRVEKKRMS